MPSNPYIIARERNVVRVDFGREPDPPDPKFPGAAALRKRTNVGPAKETFTTAFLKAEVAGKMNCSCYYR